MTESIKKNWKTLLTFTLGGFIAAIPLSLIILFIQLPAIENKIWQNKKDSVSISVSTVENILENFQKKVQAGELPLIKAQEAAAKTIESLRYLKNEYFWIHDLQLRMIMHPIKPELNGKDLSNIKDPEGKFLFVEMNKVVNSKQSGFVDYLWPKPGEDKPIPKVSYVVLYKPWGWVLGSGVYIDDIQKEISKEKQKTYFWLLIGCSLAGLISLIVGLRLLIKLILPVQKTVVNLNLESDSLVSFVETMSLNSQNLKLTSKNQSESLQETSSAISEMNEMISQTATSANDSAEIAQKTVALSQESLRTQQQLIESMNHISTLQEKLRKDLDISLNQLNQIIEIMKSISGKTDVINDIVLQTKLLSFNASVEAARAGEFGKGFSVVAEEVGKLAELSGKSSIEISEIVASSQVKVTEITSSVKTLLEKTIDDITSVVTKGTNDSKISLSALEEVLDISTKASLLSKQISIASNEQSLGSQEASKAIRKMEELNQDLVEIITSNDKLALDIMNTTKTLESATSELHKVISN